jgi:hypothetical protein
MGYPNRQVNVPIAFQIDRAEGIAHTTITGNWTADDLREHMARLRADRAYRYPELIDGREATGPALTPSDLMSLAHIVRDGLRHCPAAPRAVVVANDAHLTQVRIFRSFVAGWIRMSVFVDMGAAERWIQQAASAPNVARERVS